MNRTPDQWKDLGSYFDFQGQKIFYVHKGDNEPVVLFLHGFPTSSWDWDPIYDRIIQQYQVVMPDFLGYGFSSKPQKWDYSIMQQADMIESLMSSLKVEHCYIMAHDYGDSVAQELLARNNRIELSFTIDKLIFLNGGLFMEYSSPRPIQKLLLSPLGPLVSRLLNENRFKKSFSEIFGPKKPTEEELQAFWKIISSDQGHLIAHKLIQYIKERHRNAKRWSEAISHTDTPLKLIIGALDPVSGRPIAERFKEIAPNQEVKVFDNIGHYPQTEDPSMILEEMSEFFIS